MFNIMSRYIDAVRNENFIIFFSTGITHFSLLSLLMNPSQPLKFREKRFLQSPITPNLRQSVRATSSRNNATLQQKYTENKLLVPAKYLSFQNYSL